MQTLHSGPVEFDSGAQYSPTSAPPTQLSLSQGVRLFDFEERRHWPLSNLIVDSVLLRGHSPPSGQGSHVSDEAATSSSWQYVMSHILQLRAPAGLLVRASQIWHSGEPGRG